MAIKINGTTVIADNQNITSTGTVSATGNITGNYILGNGSQLTGITTGLSGNLTGNIVGNGFSITSLSDLTVTGNISGVTSGVTVKNYKDAVYALGTTSGTITPDPTNGSVQTITANGNITLNAFGGTPQAGQSLVLIVIQDATGGRTLTSTMLFAGGAKTLSTAASAKDIISILYDGTNYYAALTTGYA